MGGVVAGVWGSGGFSVLELNPFGAEQLLGHD
jgi:hypothetical protein